MLLSASPAWPANQAWNSHLTVGGGDISLHMDRAGLDVSRATVLNWVRECACAVATYYGRFPVPKVELEIVPVAGRSHFITGKTFGGNGAFIRIIMAQGTTEADLRKDWVLTHEMVHLAFPSVASEHHWIEEGIATYVEPIARAEVGNLDAATVWRELVQGLPLGLPQPGDQGLDYTHTWGRTYWGGALFCLLADVQIRQETHNRYGLRDALRAILYAGGDIENSWPLTRALNIGDKAIGVPVLSELYDKMKAAPVEPNLPELWSKLGVESNGKKIAFSNTAPWAAIRRAISAEPGGARSCATLGDEAASAELSKADGVSLIFLRLQ